jgi:hypothetical protein
MIEIYSARGARPRSLPAGRSADEMASIFRETQRLTSKPSAGRCATEAAEFLKLTQRDGDAAAMQAARLCRLRLAEAECSLAPAPIGKRSSAPSANTHAARLRRLANAEADMGAPPRRSRW